MSDSDFFDVELPKEGGSYHRLILTIVKDLFSAEEERLAKNINELCAANSKAYGRAMVGFLWDGDFYAPMGVEIRGRFERRSIHESLEEECARHIADAGVVKFDKHQVQQILYKTMTACRSLQDMRNALPNCVTKLIPRLKDMPRTDEPGCVFPVGSRERKQFDKIIDKLDIYAAGKLFF